MIRKIAYVLRTIVLKLRFSKRINIDGFQALSKRTTITIKNNGRIIIGKLTTYDNVHISAVGGEISIGHGVFLNRNCILVSRQHISIGDDCIVGPNVVMYDHDHLFGANGILKSEYKNGQIYIGNGCWIGAGATILRGAHIGDNCVIGAGAIIKGSISDCSIVTVHQDQHIHLLE